MKLIGIIYRIQDGKVRVTKVDSFGRAEVITNDGWIAELYVSIFGTMSMNSCYIRLCYM